MHRALRPTVRTLALAAALTLVAGCAGTSSGGGGTIPPTYDPSATVSASTGGTTSATATAATGLGYTPGDPDGIGARVVFTDFTPKDATARAVYADFQEVSRYQLQILNRGAFDVKTLEHLTTGQELRALALASARRNVGQVGTKKYADRVFTVGIFRVRALSISHSGRVSIVTFCLRDDTYEVDQSGKSVNTATGTFLIRREYKLSAKRWKASRTLTSKHGGCVY